MTRITKILNLIYGLLILFFVLDYFTSFDIKNQTLKTFVYFGVLIGTPLIFIWNSLLLQKSSKKIIGLIFPIIILAIILIINPTIFWFSTNSWQTQTILYQHAHLKFRDVEFQMQNKGARGYKKRTVEVLYLTPLFMITSEVPKDIDNKVEWKKVDKDINELGLKSP